MSRFGYTDSFSSKKSVLECAEAVRYALASIGCRSISGSTELTGKMGVGWAIRLIGGLIAPATWFPVVLTICIREGTDERQVTVNADEDFGFGTLVGIENKMRARCDELGKQIGQIIKTRLG